LAEKLLTTAKNGTDKMKAILPSVLGFGAFMISWIGGGSIGILDSIMATINTTGIATKLGMSEYSNLLSIAIAGSVLAFGAGIGIYLMNMGGLFARSAGAIIIGAVAGLMLNLVIGAFSTEKVVG